MTRPDNDLLRACHRDYPWLRCLSAAALVVYLVWALLHGAGVL